jgi:hypothetical protein
LLLAGTAPPLSRVRLATPLGAAVFTIAGKDGSWRMDIPSVADLRLFGLSATIPGRTMQSEGYLAVAPSGEVAQLRSGSGAWAFVARRHGVALLAADFDRKGGTVLSGRAPAGTPVNISVDNTSRGLSKTDAQGRFLLALNEPLKEGAHSILAQAGGAEARRTLTVSVPPRPSAGPFKAESVDGGWRIDWLTPGGGVQSTVLFTDPGPTA